MTDRLSQIKARHAEAGGGDADKAWLLEQVRRERRHALWVERRCWRKIPLLEAIGHLEARIEAAEEERNAAVAEVERLRRAMPPVVVTYAAFAEDKQYGIYDTKALLARAERERRHVEWAMRRVERLKNERDGAARRHPRRLEVP